MPGGNNEKEIKKMDENTIKLSGPIPFGEGMLEILPDNLPEREVLLPLSRYEALIRAETELYILEASIENGGYAYEKVLAAIKKARELRPDYGCLPTILPCGTEKEEDAND